MRVVIPAHDEEAVIGGLLGDIERQEYPGELTVWVLADRCTDRTVEMARSRARVAERNEGEPGKGPALDWFLTLHPLSPLEVLVVLDADNRVPADFVGRIVDRVDEGANVVQAYLDVTNADTSPVALAGALTYWAGNRMVQQARERLGWSADLGGTGMALTAEALADLVGFGGSLTEDQELGARLVVANQRVAWMHDLRVRDEKPTTLATAARQRARWTAGKRAVGRAWFWPLVCHGIREHRWSAVDTALRLVQPGRSFVALLTGSLWVIALATRSAYLLPVGLLGWAALIQVLAPVPFLVRDGVAGCHVVRYPLVTIIAALWLPVRLMSRFSRTWYHTPHSGEAPSPTPPDRGSRE